MGGRFTVVSLLVKMFDVEPEGLSLMQQMPFTLSKYQVADHCLRTVKVRSVISCYLNVLKDVSRGTGNRSLMQRVPFIPSGSSVAGHYS